MNERPQPPPTIVEAQQQHAAALKRRERRHATIVVVVGLLLVGAAALAIGRSNTVTMPPGGDGDAAVVPARRPKKRVLQPVLGAAAHHSSDHLPPKVDTAARRLWILPFEMPKGSEPRWLRGALPLLLRSKLDALATLVVDEQHASRSRDVARAAREAARAGVDIVIGGTARVAAGQLRIEAQIVHSHKPTVRKVVKVASAASARRRAVDELARRLASTLQVKIDTPPARRALALWPAGKPALLQLLGRAESALLGAGEPASTAKAAKLYRQLIGADRNLAEAHYGLARALGAARASTV
ncbi:MAG: hypothetical protein KC503_23240, partial [Myxococcales bacterium]|nr:hypothetical protein [Myxococcales bacterium]